MTQRSQNASGHTTPETLGANYYRPSAAAPIESPIGQARHQSLRLPTRPVAVVQLQLNCARIVYLSRECARIAPQNSTTMKQFFSLWPLTAVLVSLSANGTGPDGAAIVALAKVATGGQEWDRIEVWHEVGTISSGVQDTYYEHWPDLNSLKMRNVGASPKEYVLFDGRLAYRCMNSGCARMTDVESTAVKEAAYVVSFGFFFPNRFPASVRFQETRVLHNVQVDVVEVSPAGLNPMELWVDRNSHSILRIIYGTARYVPTSLTSESWVRSPCPLLPRTRVIRVLSEPKRYASSALARSISPRVLCTWNTDPQAVFIEGAATQRGHARTSERGRK